jgi:hypothetical protein
MHLYMLVEMSLLLHFNQCGWYIIGAIHRRLPKDSSHLKQFFFFFFEKSRISSLNDKIDPKRKDLGK